MKKRNLYKELGVNKKDTHILHTDTDTIKAMVMKNISSASHERKIINMSKKKIIALATCAVMLIGVTVYAASGIISTWYTSSSPADELENLPSAETCIKEMGYAPLLCEGFSNGYSFKTAVFKKNTLADENGKVVEKFKSLSVTYTKDGEKLLLSADKYNSSMEETGEIYATADGIDIYAHSFNNKIVPPDYELTEEDKAAEAAGEVYFNEDGIDHTEDHFINSVTWIKDGIRYNLLQSNGTLSVDALAEMAKELLNN